MEVYSFNKHNKTILYTTPFKDGNYCQKWQCTKAIEKQDWLPLCKAWLVDLQLLWGMELQERNKKHVGKPFTKIAKAKGVY